MLCDHRTDYHFTGETCRYASDLRPGDRVSALGGSAFAEVRTAVPHTEPGWTSLLLDTSCDGPTLIRSDTVLNVRPAEYAHPR